MSRVIVYSNDEIIGWAELVAADAAMAVADGPFYPNESYKQIQPIIREQHHYDGTLGGYDKERLVSVQEGIGLLNLCLKSEADQVVIPTQGICIVDFSEALDGEPFQLEVRFGDRETFEQFFRDEP